MTDLSRPWTRGTVHQVLTNEKYVGRNVYNRVSFKLKKLRVVNTPDMWIKKEGAFESIVPPDVFYTAQGIIRARARRYTNEELIERLRTLYQNRGFLSGVVINETDGMPSSTVYAYRFGSLIQAYLAKLLDNKQVVRYLKQRQPEVLAEFETIVQTVSLEQ